MSNDYNLLNIAYRESGAAVMSYLVRFGHTDRLIPWGSRTEIPRWDFISLYDSNPEWGKTTLSLGTLSTAAQFLCACFLAPKIANLESHEKLDIDNSDPDLTTARHLVAALTDDDYEKSYGRISPSEREKWIDNDFYDIFEHTKNYLSRYWKLVDVLAQELLMQKKISEQVAYMLMESLMEEEDKRKARRRLRIEAI